MKKTDSLARRPIYEELALANAGKNSCDKEILSHG